MMIVADYLLFSFINLGTAWLFLKFFAWVYSFGNNRRGKEFLRPFFIAGFLSIPLLLVVSVLWIPRYLPSSGVDWLDSLFYDVFSTGLTEEACKFAIFLFFAERMDSIREPRDGLIQAACVALAFATAENYKYAYDYGTSVILNRFMYLAAGHIGFAAVTGWAYATIRCRMVESEKRYALRHSLGYLILGALIHGLYNFFVGQGTYYLAMSMLLTGVFLTLFLLKETELSSPFRRFTLYDWMEAVKHLSGAARKDPYNWLVRERAGLYLLYGGKYKAASRYFNEAAVLEPDRFYLLGYLAVARILNGDEDGVFLLKLALFEMQGERKASFIRILRKVARRSERWPLIEAVLKESAFTPGRALPATIRFDTYEARASHRA